MLKSPNRPTDTNDSVNILAMGTKSEELRYVPLSEIFRIDQFDGEMRLAYRFNEATVHFYTIPNLGFFTALEKLKKLSQFCTIDLSKDIEPQMKGRKSANGSTNIFISARREEDHSMRLIHMDAIKRWDAIHGYTRLAVEFTKAETHFYIIPDSTLENTASQLEKLQGQRFVNLETL